MGKCCKSKAATAADIYFSADRLLKKYGRDAVEVAVMQADQSLAKGDMEGYRTWKRIVLVVDELTSLAPSSMALAH